MKKHLITIMLLLAIIVSVASCSQVSNPSDEDVLQAYKSATEASFWFRVGSLPTDQNNAAEYKGALHYKVEKFQNLNELKAHLKKLFSETIVDSFLDNSDYVEINGELYTRDAARGTDITKGNETYSITMENDKKIILSVNVELLDESSDFTVVGSECFDFPYEYINETWVFTDFLEIR